MTTNQIIDVHTHIGLKLLQHVAIMANEATLEYIDDDWHATGDSVDCALLVMAKKAGFVKTDIQSDYNICSVIPYEPQQKCAAIILEKQEKRFAFIKGAVETLLSMSKDQMGQAQAEPLDKACILQQQQTLSHEQYRVLAFAYGEVPVQEKYTIDDLKSMTFLGMVGMADPVRSEAKDAIENCHNAGINVAMITGDHPETASAIAKNIGIINVEEKAITGDTLNTAKSEGEHVVDDITYNHHVYARTEPEQKLDIVNSMIRNGHFVAVTGDGVNDAPALRHAHVGVAMGLKGSDVARESADIVLGDDNFSSIVEGIKQGRIAYNNIRKIIFFLISTSVAEICMFIATIILGMPMPLLATQLLWLNFVTSIIQDIALAFEPSEGNELKTPPRSPKESLFDALMIKRILITSAVMSIISICQYYWMLNAGGYDEFSARNLLLLQFVLFENIIILNCRSETASFFSSSLMRNPILIYGTILAQALHIIAMHIPFFQDALQIQPVSWQEWLMLLGFAGILMCVIEGEKMVTQ